MKTKLCLLFTVFVLQMGFSQSHKGALKPISENGFHKIILSPEFRSAIKENTDYFRILDASNNEVPYVVMFSDDSVLSEFIPRIIKSKIAIKDSITSLIIANDEQQLQNNLVLKIANTAVQKQYDISGSNDEKAWFGLVSNATLSNLNNPENTFVEKTITFPSSQYRFIRIDFKDKKSLPINVLAVGLYNNTYLQAQRIAIKAFKYTINNDTKEKTTNILFKATNAFHIDGMAFQIKTPNYLRNAQLWVSNTQTIKNKEVTYKSEIASFQLNSMNNQSIELYGVSEKEFTISIENDDNQPLEISDIVLLQNPLYVVANLNKAQRYQMLVDTTYNKPTYDLINFIPKSTSKLPETSLESFSVLKIPSNSVIEKHFWQTNTFMWLCIIIGVLAIGYFAFGLLNDINSH